MGRGRKPPTSAHIKRATFCENIQRMDISEKELPNLLYLESLPFTQCKIVLSLRGDEGSNGKPSEGTNDGWKREETGFVFYDGITHKERDELRSQLPKANDIQAGEETISGLSKSELAIANNEKMHTESVPMVGKPQKDPNMLNNSTRPIRQVKSIYQRRGNDNHPSTATTTTPLVGKNVKVVANANQNDGRLPPPRKNIGPAGGHYVEHTIDMKLTNTEQVKAPPTKIVRFRCPYCFQTFVNGESLISHLPIHTAQERAPPNDPSRITAPPSNLESSELFQKLGREIVGRAGPKLAMFKKGKKGGLPFRCSYCTRSFPKIRCLRMHVTRLHKRTVSKGPVFRKCPECNFSNNARFHLNNHMKLHTEDRRVFHCRCCSCSFRTAKNLRIHEQRFCKHLGKNWQTQRRVRIASIKDSETILEMPNFREKLVESVQNPGKILSRGRIQYGRLKLTRCDNLLGQYGLLPNGSSQINKPTRIRKRLTSSFQKNIVEITLQDQPPPAGKLWKCTICDKIFAQRENAQQHLSKRHSGFMILCPKCPSTFSRKDRMRRHLINKHKLEESHVLKLFPRRVPTDTVAIFREPDPVNVKKNPRFWKQGNRYKCPQQQCEMTFKLPVYLRRHVNMNHLGMKKHKCPECDKLFRDAYDLKMHLKNSGHHGSCGTIQEKKLKMGQAEHKLMKE